MQKSATTTELLNTNTSADYQNNFGYSEQQPNKPYHSSSPHQETVPDDLVNDKAHHEPYKNTPFWIRGSDEGWYITLGEYRVSDLLNSKEDAIKLLKNRDLVLILNSISSIMHKMLGLKKEEIDAFLTEK